MPTPTSDSHSNDRSPPKDDAVRGSAVALAAKPDFADLFEFNLTFARRKWRSKRHNHPLRVAVCGWELSHNAAGRVRTLADLWRPLAETEIIGATFPRWGNALWGPIRESEIPCHMIHVADEAAFPRQALEHVLAHPYDIVHLSKPRFPNILFGLLYKLVWDARVILDIDDEELGAIGAETTLALEALLQTHGGHPSWEHLGGKDWTRAAVGLWDIFDGTTVSNPALQARYGGPIIAHARAASQFSPSPERCRASRARFDIPQDKTVVLFFGTPRRHKGLLETAQAIAALGRDDLCYVVAGDFPDPKLKDELTAIKGADIRFLPDQPYDDIADVVALGDICVLLQRDASLLASYQLPAKMVDALAMGLLVLAQPTPALMDVVKAGAVAEVFPHTLTETLSRWLDDPQAMQSVQARGRTWFLDHLEAEHSADPLTQILSEAPPLPAPNILFERPEQRQLFERLGGWHMFSPTASPAPPALKGIEHVDTPAKAAVTDAKPDPTSAAAAASQIIVYSVLVGDYEALKEPEAIDPSVRYVLFTDNPDLKSDKWEVVHLDTLGLSPRRASRLPKLLPHRYLPEHDISLYIDHSLTLLEPDIARLANDALQGFDIAAYPHFERDCVFAEIEECLKLGKLDPITAEPFAERLRAEGFPQSHGLVENAFLLRRNTSAMRQLNDRWHEAFSSGPERDQLHLMPLLWRTGTAWGFLKDAPQFRKSPHVRFKAHTGAPEPALALPGPRRRINWVIGGPSSIGWAYENNAKRLIAQMPEFDHAINAETPSDCAVYFDTIIHRQLLKPADRAVLRLGGPNPVRRVFGEDPEAVAKGLSAFDAIIPLSGALRRLASGASARVRMIPNGLDLVQYRPAAPDRPANASFTIGFAANCKNAMERAFKGLDLLEEAVARTGVRLVTLQKGKNQIPHDRMVPDFYHRIDCLVHPVGPGKEGCSNVIMEALACGVPVITTRESGYHGEQLIHGATVLFCERSVDSLAEQIARLRDDPALRARLAGNGARFARRHHDLADTGRQVRRVLQETIAPGSLLPMQRPKLRIAMITKTFWPKFAGMELMVHNLATALQHTGNDVVLFARSYKERFDEIAHDYTLERYAPVFPALHAAFARQHRERPFDVIYVQGAYLNASMAHRLKAEFGLPVVLRTHGQDIQIDTESGYGFRLDPKVDAEITDNLRRADVNVSISRHVLRTAQALAPDTDQRMISNGVDADHFDRPRNRHLHERFNLPPETRILLTVGRNVRVKSFHLAIEALARVRARRQDVVLVHVGKEGNGENLRQAAERAGVSKAFFEYGEANYFNMPDIYAGADIFVFPSKLESFGNVTVEAMAAGLPCVEFDYGANRDKIVHTRTGYIVPHGDTGRMAERVLRLLDDPAKMAACGRAAKRHIRQTFDWPIIARKYHDAFLDHTLRRGRPGTLTPRLRIAFAADKMIRIRGGGGEKSLTTLVNAMAQRGHEVFLIIKELGVARHEAPFYPLHPGVTLCNIYGWDAVKPPKGKRPALLKAILERLQPDVVVGFFLPEFGYIARGCEGLDVPLLLSHRNDPAEKLQNLTERYPARLPDVAYADARAQVLTVQMEPYLDLLPPVARPKGVVIPNSVLPVPEAMWASPDKPAPRNVILNVARLVGAKHQDLMIRAFARLAADHPDWDIHIWGGGPLQPQIEALIADLGLTDRVLLKGTTQDILPVYRDAKIFAFPSLYEGFSRALSEAMAHGLPSVGIETCICSAAFLRESGGGIVTPDDEAAFAAALDRLIRSSEERCAMGGKAKRYVARFAPALVDDLWERVLFQTTAQAVPATPA